MEFFLCNGIKSIKILKIQFKLEEPKWHWNPSFNISNQMWLPNPLNFSKELFYLFNKIIYGEVGIFFYFFSYSYNCYNFSQLFYKFFDRFNKSRARSIFKCIQHCVQEIWRKFASRIKKNLCLSNQWYFNPCQ